MSAHVAPDVMSDLSADQQYNCRGENEVQEPQIPEHLGELQPTGCEYVGADDVLVSLKTKSGEVVSYSMKTAMLVQLVNLSVALINNCSAQVFRDLDVF